jgi:rSAM/selenodomain-associated transferase 2
LTLSIIIPVLNEQEQIAATLAHLIQQAVEAQQLEIIVVDGGSSDGTVGVVSAFAKANLQQSITILTGNRGRATQFVQGRCKARGSILYFLHADSLPPTNYDREITQAVAAGHEAGCFKMRFRSSHPWLVFISWFTKFSWRTSRGGDQSQFITTRLYDAVGGYNAALPFYEDYDLIRRLYALKKYHVIPLWLTTSARRYEDIGVFRLQWFYLHIYWKKYRGASIEEVYDYYKKWCEIQIADQSSISSPSSIKSTGLNGKSSSGSTSS